MTNRVKDYLDNRDEYQKELLQRFIELTKAVVLKGQSSIPATVAFVLESNDHIVVDVEEFTRHGHKGKMKCAEMIRHITKSKPQIKSVIVYFEIWFYKMDNDKAKELKNYVPASEHPDREEGVLIQIAHRNCKKVDYGFLKLERDVKGNPVRLINDENFFKMADVIQSVFCDLFPE